MNVLLQFTYSKFHGIRGFMHCMTSDTDPDLHQVSQPRAIVQALEKKFPSILCLLLLGLHSDIIFRSGSVY